MAIQEGRLEVLVKLHELGVDLNKPLKDGRTLSTYLEETDQTELFSKLTKLGIDLNKGLSIRPTNRYSMFSLEVNEKPIENPNHPKLLR
jgi:hypothetical protein